MAEERRTWKKGLVVEGSTKYCDRVCKILDWIYKSTGLSKLVLDEIIEKAPGIFGGGYWEILERKKFCVARTDQEQIWFDPDFWDHHTNFSRLDPAAGELKKRGLVGVYLYHELVHAYRKIIGVFIDSGGFMDVKKALFGAPWEEEFYTVGLYEHADFWCSENRFRKALKLKRRPWYFKDATKFPEEYKLEVQRRMFLRLPDPPKYHYAELGFGNPYTRKIPQHELKKYIAQRYASERRKYPRGFRGITAEQAVRELLDRSGWQSGGSRIPAGRARAMRRAKPTSGQPNPAPARRKK